MFTPRNEDELEYEVELTATGPVSQRRSVRVNAAKRSRVTARRKTRASHKAKIGGMHQRANKRLSW